MKRSRTQSPSSTDADPVIDKMYNSRRGQILFRMRGFKAFAKRRVPLVIGRGTKGTVGINGFTWQIVIKGCECAGTAANPKNCVHIGIGLRCLGDKTGELDNFDVYTANCVSSVHDCAYTVEEKILAEMTKADFAVSGENFIDNYSEIIKMGVEAMKELYKETDGNPTKKGYHLVEICPPAHYRIVFWSQLKKGFACKKEELFVTTNNQTAFEQKHWLKREIFFEELANFG
uniref:SWIM-type domain-containing protein n=1 Tax=Globodera rostochiensis TaxID=31243 RepID=A0A914HG43_GLORO